MKNKGISKENLNSVTCPMEFAMTQISENGNLLFYSIFMIKKLFDSEN
jgi:hypothetical protein